MSGKSTTPIPSDSKVSPLAISMMATYGDMVLLSLITKMLGGSGVH